MPQRDFSNVRRIVVKFGTGVLTERGRFDAIHFARLTADLAELAQSRELTLVSSGAVALGVERLGLSGRPKTLQAKQAAAAVGQGLLMHRYENAFAAAGFCVAQILLTHGDFSNRARYLNARRAFECLFEHRAIPIVNENDTVSVDEIKLGDNDNLAGLVSGLIGADLLVIASDVEGLFTADPREDPNARRIGFVEAVTPDIEKLAGGSRSGVGTGGMATKVHAARCAAEAGVPTVIVNGKTPSVLLRLLAGEDLGTYFGARREPLSARKRWLAHALRPKGLLRVDEGARRAVLVSKRSLLPSGVRAVEGQFEAGDPIDVANLDGQVFARGLAAHDADDLRRIAGKHSDEIEALLGEGFVEEAIHRDDLVEQPREPNTPLT
ncbi:MAG: glutamate 5-kinase [Myxococcales bacterium]|nr:glutamate 5-kinase [Myxococcales bacterium]